MVRVTGTAQGRIRRSVLMTGAALFILAGAVLPSFAQDGQARPSFPTTQEELDEMFPPSPEDADPLSEPEPPPEIRGPSMPAPLSKPEPPIHPDYTIEQRIKDAQKTLGALLVEIQAALKQEASVPPPPSFELECNDDLAIGVLTEQLVQAWVKQAARPELELLERLIMVRKALQLLGVKTLETHQAELSSRLLVKLRILIKTYGKERDKVLAILGFAHKAMQVARLVTNASATEEQFMGEIAGWLKQLMPDMIKEIRTQHDYKVVSAALALGQAIILSGAGSAAVDADAILAEIEAAMQFDLSLQLDLRSTGANGHVEEWTLKSALPLQTTLVKGKHETVAEFRMSGEGSGTYTRYFEQDGKITMKAQGFQFVARIKELDACKGSAILFVDRFFADTEIYQTPKQDPYPLAMVWAAFIVGFADRQVENGYELELPVVNKHVNAIDTVVNKAQGVFNLDFAVKLIHKPK